MLRHCLAAAAWLLVLVAPSLAADADISVRFDVAYGELPRQSLDIYIPKTVTADTPVFVFFHGGTFRGGEKSTLIAVGESFAEAGVIFAAPNYRLYPDVVFPQFVEDAALAVSFAWKKLRSADGSPRPLFVGGHGAGAYHAAMVAIDQRYLAANGVPANAVAGFIGLGGPYDGGCSGCEDVFPEATRPRWTVADFIDKDDPPMLLVAGEMDSFTPVRNLELLATAARGVGATVTTSVQSKASHEFLVLTLMHADGDVRGEIAAFMAETAKR